MKCSHCEKHLDFAPHYSEMIGWAKDRDAGGVNALKNRRATGKHLCNECGVHLFATGRMRSLVPEGQLTIT